MPNNHLVSNNENDLTEVFGLSKNKKLIEAYDYNYNEDDYTSYYDDIDNNQEEVILDEEESLETDVVYDEYPEDAELEVNTSPDYESLFDVDNYFLYDDEEEHQNK